MRSHTQNNSVVLRRLPLATSHWWPWGTEVMVCLGCRCTFEKTFKMTWVKGMWYWWKDGEAWGASNYILEVLLQKTGKDCFYQTVFMVKGAEFHSEKTIHSLQNSLCFWTSHISFVLVPVIWVRCLFLENKLKFHQANWMTAWLSL